MRHQAFQSSALPPMAVVVSDRSMRSVAEGLVARLAAPTEGLAVPPLVDEAIGRDHLDTASHRERTRAALGRILDDPDRRFVVLLVRNLRLSVPGDEASRRAQFAFADRQCRRGLVRLIDEVPDLSARVAEPGERAQALRVGQDQVRADLFLGLREVGLPAGRLGPSKPLSLQAPSQKGDVFEPPQRQSSYAVSVVKVSPSPHSTENPSSSVTIVRLTSGTEPVTRYGPFSVTVMRVSPEDDIGPPPIECCDRSAGKTIRLQPTSSGAGAAGPFQTTGPDGPKARSSRRSSAR
jgi:hypothetical protein